MSKQQLSEINSTLIDLFDDDEILEFGGCTRNRDRDKDRDRDRDNSDIIGDIPVVEDDLSFEALDRKDFT